MRKTFGGIGSLLQTPFGIVLATTVVWHVILLVLKIPFNYVVSGVILLLDFITAFYLLDRLIYFFSQFVLPIQNPKDRNEIYSRVRDFSSGNRGPALFIKNGRVIEHEGEREKVGPGVILLDTASAAVLRTDIEFKDTIGPGVKFTKVHTSNGKRFSEYVADSVDLRTQWQFIGPRAGESSAPSAGSKKQNSAYQRTVGQTRDGIDISPTISIKFLIKRPAEKTPTESGVTSQYGYNEEAVRNAITHEVVQLGASENKKSRLEWEKFPEHLVVNIWREYIHKFRLEDLFANQGTSGLQIIEEMINKRVTREYLEALDDNGSKTNVLVPSLEYRQLRARGLEIIEVRIHNVFFDQATEDLLCSQWNAEWMKSAKKDEALLNEQEALLKNTALNEAVKQFARIVTKKFETPTAPNDNVYALLQDFIQPLRETILTENQVNREMDKELKKLNELWKWLLVNKFILDNQKKQDKP